MGLEERIKEMVDLFGELPDPISQPKKFRHFVIMYKHIKDLKNGKSS